MNPETSDPIHEQVKSALQHKTRWWWPVLIVIVLLLVLSGLYQYGARPKAQASALAEQRAEQAQTQVRRIFVVDVKPSPEQVRIEQPATLEPHRRALIFAQVEGYLSERHVDIGDRVQAGQLLAVIATPLLEKQLTESQKQRDAASAAVEEEMRRLELATRNLQRVSDVRNKGAASQMEADDAQTEVKLSQAGVTRAQANLASAEAQVERVTRLLNFRLLQAPFEGTITRRLREVGDYIEIGGNLNDPPIFTLIDATKLRAVLSIPQQYANLISVKDPVTLRIGGMKRLPIQARVSRISTEIDPLNRTMPIEIEVDNAQGQLLSGASATVEINLKQSPENLPLLVPGNALMILPTLPNSASGGPTLAVLSGTEGDHRLEYRSVRLGRDLGNEIEIVEGVKMGERVALNLPVPLPAETRIEPLDPPAPPPGR